MLGKPIVMTRISDYIKMVDEHNGFLCDADNTLSIQQALIDASACSQEQIKEMGVVSREIAVANYTPSRVGDQWKELINSILN